MYKYIIFSYLKIYIFQFLINYSYMDIHHKRLFIAITNTMPFKHIVRPLTFIEKFELHYLNIHECKILV